MKNVARDLTNYEDGFVNGKQYLDMDRDTKFFQSFREFLKNEGVKSMRVPPRTPNVNGHLIRFFGSSKVRVPKQTRIVW